MLNSEDAVAAVIASAHDGKLVGRIRLQKIVYLLQHLGADTDFSFSYYHYGPYSRDLDNSVIDAKALELISESRRSRKSDGASYSVFETNQTKPESLFNDTQRSLIAQLAEERVSVLELAATAHWLASVENVPDWRSEIIKRKGRKTDGGRLDAALELLQTLKLAPAAA